jgi:hypothetical protein
MVSLCSQQRHRHNEPKDSELRLSFAALRVRLPESLETCQNYRSQSPSVPGGKRHRSHSITDVDPSKRAYTGSEGNHSSNNVRGARFKSTCAVFNMFAQEFPDHDLLLRQEAENHYNGSLPRPEHNEEPEPDDELETRPDTGSIADERARSPLPPITGMEEPFFPVMEDISISLKFIESIKSASLGDYLDEDAVEQIRNPPERELNFEDPDDRHSIDVYLAVTTASDATYNAVRLATLRRYPDSGMLTYHRVKRLVVDLSGVVPIIQDMCYNSCVGYTGPFADLDCCPKCRQERYDPLHAGKVPRKQFHTIPIGPQL